MHMNKVKSGFTLIELSIVLIIIGLVIGGVLVGKDLIKAAEVRSMAKKIEQYKIAINAFKLKYNAIPGDMNNAESIWGTASACNWGGSTDGKTCDGDGDGLIGMPTGAYITDYTMTYEYYTFWQHLSNSQLIEGKFSGGSAGGNYGMANPGINVPVLNNGNCISVFRWNGDPSITYNTYYSMVYKTMFHIGQPYPNDVCYKPGFTTIEALSIDTKIDDGLPGNGLLLTTTPNWSETVNCATTADKTTAKYNVDYNGIACNLLYIKISE
jgi:prepilin-type N-terminal cleavage/methylation domain-containing protein